MMRMSHLPESNDLDIRAMQLAAAGDVEAFGGIVGRHQNILLNFFRRLGADTDKAEDLVQETFVRLYQWRKRYRPTAKFNTFLFTLARHAWVDFLRKEARTVKVVNNEVPEDVKGRDDISGEVGRHLDVLAALNKLSDKMRAVVVLNVYHGLNYREIGEVLDIPEGTVKSRMFQALRLLRGFLE